MVRSVTLLLAMLAGTAAADEAHVTIREGDGRLSLLWPIEGDEVGVLTLDLRPDAPLIERIGIGDEGTEGAVDAVRGVDPVTFVTVGRRREPGGRPPAMSPFNVFFDSPAQRPHETFRAVLSQKQARVEVRGNRATAVLGGLAAGPFAGDLRLTVYPGARLVHVEAVLTTQRPDVAFLYDAGLAAESPSWHALAWLDADGRLRREKADPAATDQAVAVKHRVLVAEGRDASLACLPPPHQFFFPRDLTDNLKTAWFGRGHRGLDERSGFGVRQSETGGGGFVPWFNAPPGTEQHLSVFYLIARGDAPTALEEALRYTHGDRFPDLPGYKTFTSHWHMATAVAAMAEQARGGERTTPDLVKIFKDMNVDIVHLAEFHGDGHPQDPGPVRLAEVGAMFDECRRLSDDELLVLPGEEANVYLGVSRPGQHPGHWLYLFPKPVAWIMRRGDDQPFAEDDPKFGTVYRVGSRGDMLRLLESEHGLAWTAHPRIKASSWTPDAYKGEDFYQSPAWLGAAWKAMPADLSLDRLGTRSLDLLDDMANWGDRKQLLGEVDVFKIDRTHELYGHMNINYLKLDRVPGFDEPWTPVLDALRSGHFFVTTGEVLIRDFAIGGIPAGGSLDAAGDRPEVTLDLEWTFPLRFAEVISGDGRRVYRERFDLADTGPFGRRTLTLRPDLRGRRWARVEVWDIAADGAFTQPVWLD